MTYAEQRLAELCAIRDRALTEAEQIEVMRRAKQVRYNERRKARYRQDPEYRRSRINHEWRKNLRAKQEARV